MVNVQVVAYSDISDGERIVRVGRVGSEGGGEEVEMSGEKCGDCEENHFICLQVSCDNQVTTIITSSTATCDNMLCFQVSVIASSVGEENQRMVCAPVMEEWLKVEGGKATLGGLEDKPNVFVIDSLGPDPSVAMEMCKMSTETAVQFLCLT